MCERTAGVKGGLSSIHRRSISALRAALSSATSSLVLSCRGCWKGRGGWAGNPVWAGESNRGGVLVAVRRLVNSSHNGKKVDLVRVQRIGK